MRDSLRKMRSLNINSDDCNKYFVPNTKLIIADIVKRVGTDTWVRRLRTSGRDQWRNSTSYCAADIIFKVGKRSMRVQTVLKVEFSIELETSRDIEEGCPSWGSMVVGSIETDVEVGLTKGSYLVDTWLGSVGKLDVGPEMRKKVKDYYRWEWCY